MERSKTFLKPTLLLASTLTVMSGATIAPSLPQMARVFADTPNSEFLSKLILTVPALFIAICSPLVGRFIDRFGRLNLLYVSLVLYAIGGTSGFFMNNLYHILAGRALLGVSVAGVMTVAVTLIGDYYEGKERESFTGAQAAFMSMGGIVFVGVGGLLADISWRSPFLIYGFSILILFMALRFLPEPDRIASAKKEKTDKLPGIDYLIFSVGFVAMVLFYMLPVQIPFLLHEIGVTKNALAGLAIVIATIGSTTSSFSYAQIRTRLSYTQIFSLIFFLMAVSFAIISAAASYNILIIGMLIGGLGWGMLLPNMNIWLLSATPPAIRGTAVGILTMAIFLGQFFSPIVVAPLENAYSLASVFLFGSVFMIAAGLFFIVLHYRKESIGKYGKVQEDKGR